jgi:hypothetical protein
MDKSAKYKCPYCNKITNFNKIRRFFYKTNVVGKDAIDTFVQIFNIIFKKIKKILNHTKK